MNPIPRSEINELACKAANLAGLNPLEVTADAKRIREALPLHMRVWHTLQGTRFVAVAEYGSLWDTVDPYASYCAPYEEYNNSPEEAERFAIAHTAARIAKGPPY